MIENSNDERFSTGTTVLSADFGIGVISAIEKLDAAGDDFYVIECGSNKSKNYFPIKDNKKIRVVSTEKEFEKELEAFKAKRSVTKFESKKERQTYFDRQLNKNSLKTIISRILELVSTGDFVPREQKIVDQMVETLVLEASIIFKMKTNESKKYISDIIG